MERITINGRVGQKHSRALPAYLLDKPFCFETIEDAAMCVPDIVGHTIEPSVEAIDQALDDYLAEHEDNDTWYSFHEFIEDLEGEHKVRRCGLT